MLLSRGRHEWGMVKAEIRASVKEAMAQLPPLQRAQEEELVNAWIMGTPEWHDARCVLLYSAKKPELSLASLANAAWRAGKQVVFPRVEGDGLALHRVEGWADLAPGSFGVSEPAPGAVQVAPDQIDVAVIPGVAFTKAGDRLGQGGGFYDRLQPLPCPTWGAAFDCQILPSLPVEGHDRRVDRVIHQATILGTDQT